MAAFSLSAAAAGEPLWQRNEGEGKKEGKGGGGHGIHGIGPARRRLAYLYFVPQLVHCRAGTNHA